MTAQAYEATAVYVSEQWNEILAETFDTNEYDWYVDTDDDEYAKIIYQVKDGKYIWDATAHQGFIQRMRVTPDAFDDFYFALEATQLDSTTAADYGIIFREDTANNYYYFGINNNREYSLWLYNQSEWIALIEDTLSEAILPRESNKLAVMAEGERFVFFINDQYVTEILMTRSPKGRLGWQLKSATPILMLFLNSIMSC